MKTNWQKSIMNCPRLLNTHSKENTKSTRSEYAERNFYVKLKMNVTKKTKKNFCSELNIKYITENKLF